MIPPTYDSPYSIVQSIVPHAEQAKKNNLWQFKDASNIALLLELLLNPIDDVHRDILAIQSSLGIENGTSGAKGNMLDLIGKGLGISRQIDQEDEVFKELIFAQVLENSNHGTLDEVLIVISKKLQKEVEDRVVYLTEVFPAHVTVTVQEVDNIEALGGAAGIDTLLPAGVGTSVNVFNEEDTLPFGLEGSGGAGLSSPGYNNGHMVARYITGPRPNGDKVEFLNTDDFTLLDGTDMHFISYLT